MGLLGGLGSGGAGGSQTSLRTGSLYGKAGRGVSNMRVHHYLWVLVALEVGLLMALRVVVFKKYHGG